MTEIEQVEKSGMSEDHKTLPPKIPIMAIDDDPNIRKMLEIALEKIYDITTFASGNDILKLLGAHRPRVLILDVNLPSPNGFEICQEIRSHPRLSRTRILFITARQDNGNLIEGLSLGGNSYLTKPFEMPDLMEKIVYLLKSNGPIA